MWVKWDRPSPFAVCHPSQKGGWLTDDKKRSSVPPEVCLSEQYWGYPTTNVDAAYYFTAMAVPLVVFMGNGWLEFCNWTLSMTGTALSGCGT